MVSFAGLLLLSSASASLSAEAPTSTVMVMSGITAASEMCLVSAGGGAGFAPCLEAIAAGDGRELFQFAAGKLETTGGECLQVAGGSVALSDCAHAGGWELTASGQMKSGDVCLTADGSYPGNEDAAASAPVHASSTSNSKFHGAGAAVDADEASFWQSGEGAQQDFTVDFGASRKLSALEIVWEAPPASFAVEISADGSTWQTAYSTDVNSLFVTKAYLGGAR